MYSIKRVVPGERSITVKRQAMQTTLDKQGEAITCSRPSSLIPEHLLKPEKWKMRQKVNKVAHRREISMDDVATPTSYESQDSNLPPGTQGGVAVHYSATTMAYLTCPSAYTHV